MAPAIVTIRQPNLMVSALAIGPSKLSKVEIIVEIKDEILDRTLPIQ